LKSGSIEASLKDPIAQLASDAAAAFATDLMFVGTRSKDGSTANPNALIEYGWALKSLGRPRIIAVMNKAFGAHVTLPSICLGP